MSNKQHRIAVIGLGYVGLPLAVEFGKKYTTIGFDINQTRLNELREGLDSTLELTTNELAQSNCLSFTNSLADIESANIYIVTVPTPIDEHKQPNLNPLIDASKAIGSVLKNGDVVVFESTVYPGATEEVCVPVLEEHSGLKFNHDFFVGYSPERINPGDKDHKLINILKITSGSNPETARKVDELYKSIISAGTYMASSIKVAEAAKIIENTQRDVNIGLINELALIFDKMKIDTGEVLEAARTKWNFLSFNPGLVGGHCIGVDPYYLTYKAQFLGYHPEIILAGRRINDGMSSHVASKLIKTMLANTIHVKGAKVLILGVTFKENCPDIRNTKVVDLVRELIDYGVAVDCYDPWVSAEVMDREYGLTTISNLPKNYYDAIIVAVAHDVFLEMGVSFVRKLGREKHILFDLKYLYPKELVDLRL